MEFLYYLLAFVSGLAVTLQVSVNGELRSQLASPILSTLISFAVGILGLGLVFLYTLINGSTVLPGANQIRNISWWMLTGGLLGALYVFTSIIAAPKIGFANMLSLVICGQIILAVLFDHFGFLGNEVHIMNPYRFLGIFLLVAGVYIIQTH